VENPSWLEKVPAKEGVDCEFAVGNSTVGSMDIVSLVGIVLDSMDVDWIHWELAVSVSIGS
jgi:hypothetical protein